MSKHTPGPWDIETPFEPDSYSIVQAGLEAYEWQFIAQIPVGIPADGMFPRQEAKANARLIASAPDLLEALRPFLPAYRAYVETMQNFVVDGETLTERRFSQGERRDSAIENAFDALTKISFEQLSAVAYALSKAEAA
jgi:hypothetical protein